MAVSYQIARIAGTPLGHRVIIVTNGMKRTICLTVQNAWKRRRYYAKGVQSLGVVK